MEKFCYKITKWDRSKPWGSKIDPKPDYCFIYAESLKEAEYKISDILRVTHSLVCEYFSEYSTYKRRINDIVKYEHISNEEAEKEIQKFRLVKVEN